MSATVIKGSVEIHEEFLGGLKDLEGFSHIFLIYHFHLSKGYSLEVEPFLDKESHGLFATRAPKRPNPIGATSPTLVIISQHSNTGDHHKDRAWCASGSLCG